MLRIRSHSILFEKEYECVNKDDVLMILNQNNIVDIVYFKKENDKYIMKLILIK